MAVLIKELRANLILLAISTLLMLIEVNLDYRDSTSSEIVEAVVLLPPLYLLAVLAPLRYFLLGVAWGMRQLGSAMK